MATDTDTFHADTFHAGELAVPQRTGQRAMAMRNAAVIGTRIRGGAVAFLAEQRLVVIGAADEDERMWASILFGDKGFVSSADGTTVVIQRVGAQDATRAAIDALALRSPLDMLAIDVGTRRRLRVNGTIEAINDDEIVIAVREAYPNCPKYIHRRHLGDLHPPASPVVTREGVGIDDSGGRLLDRADTFFVATGHATRGVDVSHRGGRPGFIARVDDATLRAHSWSPPEPATRRSSPARWITFAPPCSPRRSRGVSRAMTWCARQGRSRHSRRRAATQRRCCARTLRVAANTVMSGAPPLVPSISSCA